MVLRQRGASFRWSRAGTPQRSGAPPIRALDAVDRGRRDSFKVSTPPAPTLRALPGTRDAPLTDGMDPQNLSLDREGVLRGERYRKLHRTNLSQLVSGYLASLPIDSEEHERPFTPAVR